MDLLGERLEHWERELTRHHSLNVDTARSDPQKSGHAAEGVWVQVVRTILPPSYRVVTRKYIGSEVDLVILPPSAPLFYDDADVTDIPAGVATAVVHVKNSLDRKELRDAMARTVRLNAADPIYRPSPAAERLGLPAAVVALGSKWAGGFSSFLDAFDSLVGEFEIRHPSQLPGFVGTPDWEMSNGSTDMQFVGGADGLGLLDYQRLGEARWRRRHVVLMIGRKSTGRHIHAFAQWLYSVCAASDPAMEPMRVAITQLFGLNWSSSVIPFEAKDVYSDETLRRLRLSH